MEQDKEAGEEGCSRGLALETRLVHAGERLAPPVGKPVTTPIYATTTFTYDSMAEMDEVFAGSRQGYCYSRYSNPTVHALETAVRSLEDGAGACAFGSGMAALHAAFLACDLAPGSAVVAARALYGTTTHLLQTVFRQFGVETILADFGDLAALRELAHNRQPRALVCETISNPLLEVCDIEAVAEIAREVGARLVVDNTFASPFLCTPLRLGADFSVHSATKYLSGHGDATGGVAVAREAEDWDKLVAARASVGGVLSVFEAHEIMRGVKTLGVRMERQCANARQLAGRLSDNPKVGRVHHPGLNASNGRSSAVRRVLRAPHTGALVSIRLADGTRAAAFRFMDNLKLCVRLTSLGDVVTSVSHPATSSHRSLSPEDRREMGITECLVRISVGIEDAEDIIRDVEQALES
jgi:cystathionine beta-lyase/cystathionine gamma-synthase